MLFKCQTVRWYEKMKLFYHRNANILARQIDNVDTQAALTLRSLNL